LLLCLFAAAGNGYSDTLIINVYDANGNLATGDGRYYEYNDANQLARVRQGDQAGAVIAEYFYDSSGQRIKKIENGVTTYYIGKHFEKQVSGTNAGNTSYYFSDGGERVAKKDPGGNVFYYHLDHLDGINVVTDSAGTEVARTDYLPFGEAQAGGSGSEKYAYTGKEKDKTDLYYFDARYNSPEFRHFTQADVAEPDYDDPQDLNRYAYVGNNPTSYVDPDGFKKKKKAKLSKREKWMIAHGRDPDKDKTTLKKAKEKERAAAHYAKHHPASSRKVGAGYSLTASSAGGSSVSTASSASFGSDTFINARTSGTGGEHGAHGWSRAFYGGLGLIGGEVGAILNGAAAVRTFDVSKGLQAGISLGAAIYAFGEILAGAKEGVSGKKVPIKNDLDIFKKFDEADTAITLGGGL
jgi:RHS repeat-associated protein